MPEIVLATLNARYIHAPFGLRYLLANLGDQLRPRACLAEFDINQRPSDIAESLLHLKPCILGLGVYIWNVTQTTELVAMLKPSSPTSPSYLADLRSVSNGTLSLSSPSPIISSPAKRIWSSAGSVKRAAGRWNLSA